MTFMAITTPPKQLIIFPHLARVKHHQITRKNPRFLHINRGMEIFLNSHNQFIQDPGCKPAVEKETWSPHFPNNF